MLRARNESTKIITCLASILGMFDEIVYIDNASSDDTLDRVVQFKIDYDARHLIRIAQYPHVIARCGDEHWGTPEDSVHSLVYYYNWCLSRCRCAYVFKWDADMALAANATSQMRELFSTLRDDDQALWVFRVQTAYRDTHGSCTARKEKSMPSPGSRRIGRACGTTKGVTGKRCEAIGRCPVGSSSRFACTS